MKNLSGLTFPNKDTPKTRPVLYPNRRRGSFRGVCFCALHGYVKNPAGFGLKPSARIFSGRMLLRPYTGTCKIWRVLVANPWRGTFRGVCNTPLHGYMKNLAGFIFPHPDTPKTHPVLGLDLRRGVFRGVCNTPLHGCIKNLTGFGFRHTTWRETRRVLDFATRHGTKPGGFWTLPLDMARNPAGFGLCHST